MGRDLRAPGVRSVAAWATGGQNLDLQCDAPPPAGCERSALEAAPAYLKSEDRLGRSLHEMLDIA